MRSNASHVNSDIRLRIACLIKQESQVLNINIFSGKCTGLPTNISRLVTDAQFPVSQGTPVKVGCEEGFTVDGNDVITCVKGTLFSWEEEEPECEPLLEG